MPKPFRSPFGGGLRNFLGRGSLVWEKTSEIFKIPRFDIFFKWPNFRVIHPRLDYAGYYAFSFLPFFPSNGGFLTI
jgi:hypothetical protein